MATVRRPLVRVGGKTRQLPAGDSLLGIPVYLPATQQGGTVLRVAINTITYTVAATQQGGTVLAVAVAING